MPKRPPTFRPNPAPKRDRKKSERDKFYSSAAWMRLRRVHLAEHPLCERCQADGKLVAATIAHHKTERLARPDLSMVSANLESLCNSCHSKHHRETTRKGF